MSDLPVAEVRRRLDEYAAMEAARPECRNCDGACFMLGDELPCCVCGGTGKATIAALFKIGMEAHDMSDYTWAAQR